MAPLKQLAVIMAEDRNPEIREVDVPKFAPDEILVRVEAAALNPADWKSVDTVSEYYANIIGCDFAGTVEEVGSDVSPSLIKIGDRVAGFVHGSVRANGSFAQYVTARTSTVILIPGWIPFTDAAQLSMASLTASNTLWSTQKDLPTPLAPAPAPTEDSPATDILVWGGSSSVGQYAVQLAALSGLRVIATSSPKNFELLRSFGVSDVFDYRDPQTPARIRELTRNQLRVAVDCISEGETPKQIADAISTEGGHVSIVLPYKPVRPEVTVGFSGAYMMLGETLTNPIMWPRDPEQTEFSFKMTALLKEILAQRKLRTGPIRLLPDGLASVREGLKLLKDGKVSAEKLTIKIADTPQLKV